MISDSYLESRVSGFKANIARGTNTSEPKDRIECMLTILESVLHKKIFLAAYLPDHSVYRRTEDVKILKVQRGRVYYMGPAYLELQKREPRERLIGR